MTIQVSGQKGFSLVLVLSVLLVMSLLCAHYLRKSHSSLNETSTEIGARANRYTLSSKVESLRSQVFANLQSYIATQSSPAPLSSATGSPTQGILMPSNFSAGTDTYTVTCYREGTSNPTDSCTTDPTKLPKFFEIKYTSADKKGIVSSYVEKFQYSTAGSSSSADAGCLTGVKSAVANYYGAHALLNDGSLRAWGMTSSNHYPAAPQGLKMADAIGAQNFGNYYLVNGSLYYTDASTASAPIATPVPGVQAGAVGSITKSGKCMIVTDLGIGCWNTNDYGQVGNGTTTPYSSPWYNDGAATTVDSLEFALDLLNGFRPIEISSNGVTSCLLSSSGKTWCWGEYIGNGTTTSSPTSITFASSLTPISITTAYTGGGCAVMSDHSVQCWSIDVPQDFGFWWALNSHPNPTTVPGISNAISVAIGVDHACVLISDGTVSCWGQDGTGQTGAPYALWTSPPAIVPGITNAVDITAGMYFTCATLADTTVSCWGNNSHGELGDGTTTSRSTTACVKADPSDTAHMVSGIGTSGGSSGSGIVGLSNGRYVITSKSFSNASIDDAIAYANSLDF